MRRNISGNLFTVAITVIVTLAVTAGVLAFKDKQRVPPGTLVGKIDISGLEYSVARDRLAEAIKLDDGQLLTLRQGDEAMRVAIGELGVEPDIDATLKQVQARRGLFASVATRGSGTNVLSPVLRCDAKKLEQTVAQAAAAFDRAPVDARVYLDGEALARANEVTGFKTDTRALTDLIKERLAQGDLQDVQVPGRVQRPTVTAKELEAVRDILAVHVTTFTPEPAGRARNIELSAQRVNNTLLPPEAVFSLNQVVGERTARNGYQPAPVFQDGRTVNDLGGGVCQLASTIYNAAVAADLKITERQPHSYAVDYVEPGQDATIAWDQHDLKFVNTTGSPLLIASQVEDGKLQVRFYGKATDPGKKVELVTDKKAIPPKVTVITNSRLTNGQQVVRQEGSAGYETKTYRVESKDGKEMARTLVSADTYQPRPWIIEVAPGATPRLGQK